MREKRQTNGDLAWSRAKFLAVELQNWLRLLRIDRGRGRGKTAQLVGGAHCIEHTGDDLGSAPAVGLVRRLGLEQLRVSEDDTELVIQTIAMPQSDAMHLSVGF